MVVKGWVRIRVFKVSQIRSQVRMPNLKKHNVQPRFGEVSAGGGLTPPADDP